MKHYFQQLKLNGNTTEEIQKTLFHSLKPLEIYINNAIDILKKKEFIEAKWEKVKIDNLVELTLKGKIYQVSPVSEIQLTNLYPEGTFEIQGISPEQYDYEEDIILKISGEKKKITINPDNFPYENKKFIYVPELKDLYIDSASWAGDSIKLIPKWLNTKTLHLYINRNRVSFEIKNLETYHFTLFYTINPKDTLTINDIPFEFKVLQTSQALPQNVQKLNEDEQKIIFYSQKTLNDYKEYKPFLNTIPKNQFYLDKSLNNPFPAEHHEGFCYIIENQTKMPKTVFYQDKQSGVILEFDVNKVQDNHREQFWIQLIDEIENEEIPGYSKLKYFFDDGITIIDERKNEYNIAKAIESEYKLLLRKGRNYTYPQTDKIKIKTNTYQLEKQLEAIQTLYKMPHTLHENLVKLFLEKNKLHWDISKLEPIQEWFVLTDETRSGAKEQREFVQKALYTPDFALMEGPPGSGKTTVILELICQIIKQGKRVLLCGSTHVAIDNVLERLKKYGLIQKIGILPLRIGDENKISDSVVEYQIDNLYNSIIEYNPQNPISKEFLTDIANLVCGTTIGILQHPKFKNRKKQKYGQKNVFIEPIIPEFDYLIIDETSKTTFQEFLIPALYAKKWILVGDIMQLSPFAEREFVTRYIENLEADIPWQDKKQNVRTKPEPLLPKAHQTACFILQKVSELLSNDNQGKYIFVVENDSWDYLKKEFYLKNLDKYKIYFLEQPQDSLISAAYDGIFVKQDIFKEIKNKLPETHLLLRTTEKNSLHSFKHTAIADKIPFRYKNKGKEYTKSKEIEQEIERYFSEKNWAEEITWRLDREYQQRLLEEGTGKTRNNYRKAIEELLPTALDNNKKEQLIAKINEAASIAYPSILETLLKGIPRRIRKNLTTVLSDGFSDNELKTRRTILAYQHRMHPQISQFPREKFYKRMNKEALLDLAQPQSIQELRKWDYLLYPSRSIWKHVEGKTNKNYNLKEVETLMHELKQFVIWALNNPHPLGEPKWEIACLTFYKGQEAKIREELRKYTKKEAAYANFVIQWSKIPIEIKLHTVDKFQGQEADIVFLSMVQTKRVGFMDNINRLNVAITRARYQLVIIGNQEFFKGQNQSDELKALALETKRK